MCSKRTSNKYIHIYLPTGLSISQLVLYRPDRLLLKLRCNTKKYSHSLLADQNLMSVLYNIFRWPSGIIPAVSRIFIVSDNCFSVIFVLLWQSPVPQPAGVVTLLPLPFFYYHLRTLNIPYFFVIL